MCMPVDAYGEYSISLIGEGIKHLSNQIIQGLVLDDVLHVHNPKTIALLTGK